LFNYRIEDWPSLLRVSAALWHVQLRSYVLAKTRVDSFICRNPLNLDRHQRC